MTLLFLTVLVFAEFTEFPFFTAITCSIRKNSRNTNDAVRSISEILASQDRKIDYLTTSCTEQRKEMQEMHAAFKLDKPDLSQYFPISKDDQVYEFLSRNGQYTFDQKLRALVNLCRAQVRPGMTTKQFAVIIPPILFERSYMLTHKWYNNEW